MLRPSKKSGKWGYLDSHNQWVIQPRFGQASRFSDHLAAVAVPTGGGKSWGYIDEGGDWRIAARFHEASDFHEGLAAVMTTPAGPTGAATHPDIAGGETSREEAARGAASGKPA